MIIIVAPYTPVGRSSEPHLGAARKIEMVVGLLSRCDPFIVMINTAHNSNVKAPLTVAATQVGGVDVVEVTLPTSTNRRTGKLWNLFDVQAAIECVLNLGEPQLVWLYNGYAFESLFGRAMAKRIGCPVILELEDWHFSRGRGLNPKPYLDWAIWRSLMPHISYAFSVNSTLADRLGGISSKVGLFPGIVSEGIKTISKKNPPFSSITKPIVVGYFGGLSSEKGADLVLALVKYLPNDFKLVVTGAGPLETDFIEAAEENSARIQFHGRVNEDRLLGLISQCDVILNPHSPISKMADGVFPFKVIEGIASGRLVISTPVPGRGLETVLQGVKFIDHGFSALLDAVIASRDIYTRESCVISSGATEAARMFDENAILDIVKNIS